MLLGQQLNVWLTISGHPSPKVAWAYNEKDLLKDKEVNLTSSGGKHLMSITKAASKHRGVYKIKAVNAEGQNVKEISVTVLGMFLVIYMYTSIYYQTFKIKVLFGILI